MSSLNNTEIKMAGDFNPEPAIVDDANLCTTNTAGDVEEECPPPIITAENMGPPIIGVKRNILLEANRKFISFGYWFIKRVSSSDIIQPELVEPLMKELELLSDPTVQNEFVDSFNKDYSNFIKKEVNDLIKEESNKQKKLNKISQKVNKPIDETKNNVKEKTVRKPRKVKKTDDTTTPAETTPLADTENNIGQQGKEIFEKLIEAVNGTDEVKPKKVKRVYNKKSKPVESVVSEENATTVSSDTTYLVSPTTNDDDIQPDIVSGEPPVITINQKVKEPKEPKVTKVKEPKEPKVKKVKEPKEPKEPKVKKVKEPKEPKVKKVKEPMEPEIKEPEINLHANVSENPPIIIDREIEEQHVKTSSENEDDDDEYDEINAVVITFNGTEYLHDIASNIVYTMEQEETGIWNGNQIEFHE